MKFDTDTLGQMIDGKKKILVKQDDEFDMSDQPNAITLAFIVALTVEMCFVPDDAKACMIDGDVMYEAFFRFCYSYNEGDENHFALTVKKEQICRFVQKLCLVSVSDQRVCHLKTGSDECERGVFESIKAACMKNCLNLWTGYFEQREKNEDS